MAIIQHCCQWEIKGDIFPSSFSLIHPFIRNHLLNVLHMTRNSLGVQTVSAIMGTLSQWEKHTVNKCWIYFEQPKYNNFYWWIIYYKGSTLNSWFHNFSKPLSQVLLGWMPSALSDWEHLSDRSEVHWRTGTYTKRDTLQIPCSAPCASLSFVLIYWICLPEIYIYTFIEGTHI